MRSASSEDVNGLALEPEDANEDLSPFAVNDYYEEAFCVLLDGGMSTCCG